MDNSVNEVKEIIALLNAKLSGASAQEVLDFFLNGYEGNMALATSLGVEDQVLTDMICTLEPSTNIFTLDTGRLPQETYSTIEKTNSKYGIAIKIYFPNAELVEDMVTRHGPNLFYDSVTKRQQCCYVRKIEPLKRALQDVDVWVCGLRKEQSITREELELVQWDQQFGVIKISPLLHWNTEQVWQYVKDNNVPYNPLHDKGYPSIGCAPCTRAVSEGEDIRAGRWWWEKPEHKECGLHLNKEL